MPFGPKVSTLPAKMIVRVNMARCTGAADCYDVAPRTFRADRYGYPIVEQFEEHDLELRTEVMEAVARCPRGAIEVIEIEDGPITETGVVPTTGGAVAPGKPSKTNGVLPKEVRA
jgi:ferredoxin